MLHKRPMNILDRFNKNIRIRTKMIMIISGVLLISIIPLAFIILNRSQDIVLKMTFEVCTNLAQNISNLATEELLINETYDTTKTSISRLKSSGITGLLDSFVVNVDGEYVAEMASEEQIGKQVSQKEKDYYRGLTKLDMQDTSSARWKTKILRFSFPISILYRGQQMRVGTAVFEFDRAKVYEPVYKVRNTIILVSAILFVLGIAIAFYTAIIFSKPILKLSESVKRIGEGDLNHRIKLTGKDEIGQLAQTFNQMTSQIQDFTQNLENKVAERTDQLNKSLQEVQTLKIAQDGDYYLTSLLLSPLQPNNNRSSRIKTEFLIEQKKKFTFRKWDSEIGGDICITDTIKLLNKEYTVFINGDAMGKSIQGAGGALVLGVVFNAGLMHSRVEKYQGIHPEAWLKERFLDLHNVFLSFDGSMYISICMGLIDNETGMMFFINAEHPWTVLYRDGKAAFLEQELALRKLGTPEQEDQFFVRTFQLMSGDVIITGSDGRDDIQLFATSSIQEDENEFLKRVEEADGNLGNISKKIKELGKIIDDFSLLRISFNESYEALPSDNKLPPEASSDVQKSLVHLEKGELEEAYHGIEKFLDDYREFPDLLKVLGKYYFGVGEFAKAIECYDQYLKLVPGDNEYLLLLSDAYRLSGKLNLAADVGERLFLRHQTNPRNLLNLGRIYLQMHVFGRSENMIERLLGIEPENDEAARLKIELAQAKEHRKARSNEDATDEKAEFIYRKAETLYKAKNYLQALDQYETLMDFESYSASPKLLLKVANCNSFLGNYEKAIIYYNRSISEDPLNIHAYNNLGGVFYKLGYPEKAKLEWKKALEIEEDFAPATFNLEKIDKIALNGVSGVEKI